jgi:uncharacterized SAM-binding protein YcdF (DUF218 family)
VRSSVASAPAKGMRLRIGRGAADKHRRLSRWVRRFLISAAVLIVVFGIVTARLFVWPAQGMPARVSAIVMLAGPGDRLPVALQLARQHRAPMLVVSQGWQGYGGPCPSAVAGVKLVCFDPNPGDTRGEAEFASQLSKRYHWTSVVLVTSRAQDTRARILMRRCLGGSTIYVITASLPLSSWPYQIAYEWGALFKALVLYGACLRQQPGGGGK